MCSGCYYRQSVSLLVDTNESFRLRKDLIEIEPDEPTMLPEILERYIQGLNYKKSEIANILLLTQSEFEE